MATKKATITFKGDKGYNRPHTRKCTFPYILSTINAQQWVNYLKANITDCNCRKFTYYEESFPLEAPPNNDVEMTKVGVFVMKHSSGSVHQFKVPGIYDSRIELTDQGWRIRQSALDEFANALANETGETWSPVQGWVEWEK